jgi:lysophospholipase L1-like esterase
MKQFWKDGDVVLFQGDSITDCCWDRQDPTSLGNGYPSKIARIYDNLFPGHKVTFVNKGISGNRSKDIVNRYESDIKEIKPDFISILVGINDVWRKYDRNDPTSTEEFEENYSTILKDIKRDLPDTKIMIIEPFLLHTDADKIKWHETLDPMIGVVRKLAHEYADYFLPMDGIYQCYINKGISEAILAWDGVHPTEQSHAIIAYEYMKLLEII